MRIADDKLRGRTVIGAGGQAIGEVEAVIFETDTWSVTSLEVRPRKEVAGVLGASRRLLRPVNIEVPVRAIQSFGDAILLNLTTGELGRMLTGAEGAAAH